MIWQSTYKPKNKVEGNTNFKLKTSIVFMHFKVIGHQLYILVNHQIYENEFMKEDQEALSSSIKTLKRVVINSIPRLLTSNGHNILLLA